MFQVGVVTGELDDDLEVALRQAVELEFDYVELYGFWGKRFYEHDRATLEKAKALLDKFGLPVRTMLNMTFKKIRVEDVNADDLENDENFLKHMEMHRRGIEAVKVFGAQYLRVFAFERSVEWPLNEPIDEKAMPVIVKALRMAADEAADAGVELALENVRLGQTNTGANMMAVLERLERDNVGFIWDPANDCASGSVGYPDGYELVKDHIRDVHFKDVRILDWRSGQMEWACIGHGDLAAVGQLRALIKGGYSKGVTVETHWRKPDGSNGTFDTTRNLRRLIEAASYTAERS